MPDPRRPGRCLGPSCPRGRRQGASRSLVEGYVVRHDHVRAPADADLCDVDPAAREHVQLRDQRRRVDDHAGADDRGDMRIEHPGRDEMELEDLVTRDDRMARVVPALVADDHRHLLGEEVGGLALPLVAPLEADDHGGWHVSAPSGRDLARPGHEKAPRRSARDLDRPLPCLASAPLGGATDPGRSTASRDDRCALLARSLDLPAPSVATCRPGTPAV